MFYKNMPQDKQQEYRKRIISMLVGDSDSVLSAILLRPKLLDQIIKQVNNNNITISLRFKILKILNTQRKIHGFSLNEVRKILQQINKYFSDPTFIEQLKEQLSSNTQVKLIIQHEKYIPQIVNIIITTIKQSVDNNPYEINDEMNLKNLINNLNDDGKLGALIHALLRDTNLLNNLLKEPTNNLKIIFNAYNTRNFAEYSSSAFNNQILNLLIKLIVEDETMIDYFNKHEETLAKILTTIIDSTPEIQAKVKGVSMKNLINTILEKNLMLPLIKKHQENTTLSLLDLIITTANNTSTTSIRSLALDFATTVNNYVVNVTQGDSIEQKNFEYLKNIISADWAQPKLNQTKKNLINLKDIIEKHLPTSENNYQKIFSNIKMIGYEDTPLIFENFLIEDIPIINSKLQHVSFKDTKFNNVSFFNSTFYNVDFNGAQIDAATLKSLIEPARQGVISLNGVKLYGDFSNVDLSNISLQNVDLSQVTNLDNVNLQNTNLRNAVLPNKKLLIQTYNLDKAKNLTLPIPSILSKQKARVVQKTIDAISKKAICDNNSPMTDQQKKELTQILNKLLATDSIASNYIKESLETTPQDMVPSSKYFLTFPMTSDDTTIKHVNDYLGKTRDIMTILYNNRNNPEMIENMILIHKLANEVTATLFQSGKDRGKDSLMIRDMMQEIMSEISKDQTISISTLNLTELSNKIADMYRAHAIQPTWAGWLLRSGGIQLNTEDSPQGKIKAEITFLMTTAIKDSKATSLQTHSSRFQR